MVTISGCSHLKLNLKAKIYKYVNSITQRCPNKIIKISQFEEDFCHLPPVSATPVVHLDYSEYLQEFSKKFETALLVYSGAWGKLIHEKNISRKSRGTVPLSTRSDSHNPTIPKLCLYTVWVGEYERIVLWKHRFVQRVVITSQEFMQVWSMHENAFNASLSCLMQKLFSAFSIVLVITYQCMVSCVHEKCNQFIPMCVFYEKCNQCMLRCVYEKRILWILKYVWKMHSLPFYVCLWKCIQDIIIYVYE